MTVFSPGPGGGLSNAQSFTIDPAIVNNPTPVITSINPNAATEGDAALNLTVNGNGFIDGSVVRWNGADRVTTYVSANQLQAAVTAGDLATAGSASVTVFTPTPGGGTSNGQSFTVQSASGGFFDAFARADGASIGNGWIEKNPAAFQLQGGAAVKQATGLGYRDNLVYRPSGEDLLDVEASIEFSVSQSSPGYPQLFTRIQSASAATPNTIDGYILFVNNAANQAILGRQEGASFVSTLAALNFAPGLNTTDTFRMRLRALGTSPVQLTAFMERWDGSAWEVLGQVFVNDASGARISTPGSVGFSGYIESLYSYDNFTATNLGGGSNPLPILSALNPAIVSEGGSDFALTVTGSNFIPGSVVRIDGIDRVTTFVSSSEVQATITAADIAVAGTASISVYNPAPGGGSSGAQTLTIDPAGGGNPVPVLTSLNPNSATEGGSAFLLDVSGANFVAGSVVRWNGADRATSFVSPTLLQATITSADIATAGTAAVTVFTAGPGGGTSAQQTFTIDPTVTNNPVPALASLNPASATEGGSAFSLTVNGSNFIPGSVVRWNGADRVTTFVSANALQAAITAADIASAGSAGVSVFNPAPGGGSSAVQTFTIVVDNPGASAPFVNSVSPENVTAGSADVVVTVIGSDFDALAVGNWNGSPRPTTVLSDQALEVTIAAADLVAADVNAITVVNPPAEGGGSDPHPFFVLDTNSTYFFDSFNTADSPTLGNGWTEKTPEPFSITNNRVTSVYSEEIYRDTLVYRPQAEDRLDVEVSAEFVRQPAGQYTQIHARAKRATVGTPDYLESYIFYVEDNEVSGAMAFAVGPPVVGTGECIIDQLPLPQPLQVGERYRMRFFVTGQDPVRLEGRVDWFQNGAWQPFFSSVLFHDENTQRQGFYCPVGYMPDPIAESGSSGFAKWVDQADDYDNYYWVDLSGATGIPSISAATPDAITAGGGDLNLIVDGSGFVASSVVQWNGSPRTTTYVDSTTLQATIPAADIASVGTANVTVVTPPPGGGTSNAVTVDIVPPGQIPNPVPTLAGASPTVITAGQPDTQVTISGAGFVQDSVVRWNGSDRPTSYVSDTTLTVLIPAADIATAGTGALTVFSPSPGGGTADAQSIAILGAGDFADDFDRPDGAVPGNGWIEKNPAAFSLVGGTLDKNNVGTSYTDNAVYRPLTEARANVETSAEFQLNTSVPGYPQIFARLQTTTITLGGILDGYILYINNGNSAVLGRQTGSSFVTSLATISLSEGLNMTSTYRMRLSATGTAPVTVTGTIERLSESGFVSIGQATVQDASAQRISGPGVSAIGGYIEANYSFDNFRDSDLP